MRIVARLKSTDEIKLLSQLKVDVLSLDTEFSIKPIKVFTIDQITEVVDSASSFGLAVYLNLNKMFHEIDIPRLKEYLLKLNSINIQALVISDFTVYVLAKELSMEAKIIYQPGTMNTDSYSAKYLAERGVLGMTISREITLSEIQKISENSKNIELSLIGHGYLDMFYSKRKLITNYLIHKKISGIKVLNQHDFRLTEEIRKDDFYPILEDEFGTMIFRSKKLLSIDELKDLSQILDDFFIERIFLEDQEYYDSIRLYTAELDKDEFLSRYQDFDSGFYYRRTEKLKGDDDES